MINMDAIACELSSVENGVIVFSSSTGKHARKTIKQSRLRKKWKITVKFLDAYNFRPREKNDPQNAHLKNPEGIRDCGA